MEIWDASYTTALNGDTFNVNLTQPPNGVNIQMIAVTGTYNNTCSWDSANGVLAGGAMINGIYVSPTQNYTNNFAMDLILGAQGTDAPIDSVCPATFDGVSGNLVGSGSRGAIGIYNSFNVTSYSVTTAATRSVITRNQNAECTGFNYDGVSIIDALTSHFPGAKPPPPPPPSIAASNVAASTGSDSATVVWVVSPPQSTNDVVNYQANTTGPPYSNSQAGSSSGTTLSGLTASTTYHYQACSSQANGALSSCTVDATFTTGVAPLPVTCPYPTAATDGCGVATAAEIQNPNFFSDTTVGGSGALGGCCQMGQTYTGAIAGTISGGVLTVGGYTGNDQIPNTVGIQPGNTIIGPGVPPGITVASGSGSTGTFQLTNAGSYNGPVTGFMVRPPWNVAGVDYPVGIESTALPLIPWTAIPSCSNYPTPTPVCNTGAAAGAGAPAFIDVRGPNPIIQRYDFATAGGTALRLTSTGANPPTGPVVLKNDRFPGAGPTNFDQLAVPAAIFFAPTGGLTNNWPAITTLTMDHIEWNGGAITGSLAVAGRQFYYDLGNSPKTFVPVLQYSYLCCDGGQINWANGASYLNNVMQGLNYNNTFFHGEWDKFCVQSDVSANPPTSHWIVGTRKYNLDVQDEIYTGGQQAWNYLSNGLSCVTNRFSNTLGANWGGPRKTSAGWSAGAISIQMDCGSPDGSGNYTCPTISANVGDGIVDWGPNADSTSPTLIGKFSSFSLANQGTPSATLTLNLAAPAASAGTAGDQLTFDFGSPIASWSAGATTLQFAPTGNPNSAGAMNLVRPGAAIVHYTNTFGGNLFVGYVHSFDPSTGLLTLTAPAVNGGAAGVQMNIGIPAWNSITFDNNTMIWNGHLMTVTGNNHPGQLCRSSLWVRASWAAGAKTINATIGGDIGGGGYLGSNGKWAGTTLRTIVYDLQGNAPGAPGGAIVGTISRYRGSVITLAAPAAFASVNPDGDWITVNTNCVLTWTSPNASSIYSNAKICEPNGTHAPCTPVSPSTGAWFGPYITRSNDAACAPMFQGKPGNVDDNGNPPSNGGWPGPPNPYGCGSGMWFYAGRLNQTSGPMWTSLAAWPGPAWGSIPADVSGMNMVCDNNFLDSSSFGNFAGPSYCADPAAMSNSIIGGGGAMESIGNVNMVTNRIKNGWALRAIRSSVNSVSRPDTPVKIRPHKRSR
jgi:hypothetical protein